MSIKLSYNKEITLNKNKYKVFSIKITSSKNIEVKVKFNNIKAICYNCTGKDYLGNFFNKSVLLQAGKTKTLWCSVKGQGKGSIVVLDKEDNILVTDTISSVKCKNNLEDKLDKILWLNSSLGIDNSIPKPFRPVKYKNKTINILGREITINSLCFLAPM